MFSKVSDKVAYATSVDPDEIAPEAWGSYQIRFYTVRHPTKNFTKKKKLHKKQNVGENICIKKIRNFRTCTIFYIQYWFNPCPAEPGYTLP